MKISQILLAVTLLIGIVPGSCQQKTGQQKSSESEAVESDEFTEKLGSINPGLRNPSKVMVALDMADAAYNDGLALPMGNADHYAQSEVQAALALGVYTVDTAYLVSQQKKRDWQHSL